MRRHGGRWGLPGSGDGLTARKRSSVGARSAMLRRPVWRRRAAAPDHITWDSACGFAQADRIEWPTERRIEERLFGTASRPW